MPMDSVFYKPYEKHTKKNEFKYSFTEEVSMISLFCWPFIFYVSAKSLKQRYIWEHTGTLLEGCGACKLMKCFLPHRSGALSITNLITET